MDYSPFPLPPGHRKHMPSPFAVRCGHVSELWGEMGEEDIGLTEQEGNQQKELAFPPVCSYYRVLGQG